jgi:hypothetical protein
MLAQYHSRRMARLLIAVATGVLQLHLFFVMELHHHESGPFPYSSSDNLTGFHSVSVDGQPCPACQMARQGSIYATSFVARPIRLNEIQVLSIQTPSKFSNLPKERPSGRAPPLFF